MIARPNPWTDDVEISVAAVEMFREEYLRLKKTDKRGRVRRVNLATLKTNRAVCEQLIAAHGDGFTKEGRRLVIAARRNLSRRYQEGDGVLADYWLSKAWLYTAAAECPAAAFDLAVTAETADNLPVYIRFLLAAQSLCTRVQESDEVATVRVRTHLRLAVELLKLANDESDEIKKVPVLVRMTRNDVREAGIQHCREGIRLLSTAPAGSVTESVDEVRALLEKEEIGEGGLVVFASMGTAKIKDAANLKAFAKFAGKPIPLARCAEPEAVFHTLTQEFPHMAPLFQLAGKGMRTGRMLGNDVVRLPRILLVGPPAVGKTFAAMRMGELLGLPTTIIPAGGAGDNRSIQGTGHGWHSGHPSSVLQYIVEGERANPLLIVDEIDKDTTSRHNGRISDTLLQMLDPGTSQRWLDDYLQTPCDVSRVNWVLTANSTVGIEPALLSRVQVCAIKAPAMRDIVRSVVTHTRKRIAAEHGVNLAIIPTWTEDEYQEILRLRPRDAREAVRYVEHAFEVLLRFEFDNRSIN